jgi:hypothetical protein
MSVKFSLSMAFLTALNCGIAVFDDNSESNMAAYLWGATSVLYLTSAGIKAKDNGLKKAKDQAGDPPTKDNNFDIM